MVMTILRPPNAAKTCQQILAMGTCGVLPLLMTWGCTRASGLNLHPVSGTMTFDGRSVEEGSITFHAVSGDTRGFAGPIKGGAYKAETFAAPMKVFLITAFRDVPGTFIPAAPDQPKEPAREQYIPTRYNDTTELKADIPSGGTKQLEFFLKSK